VLPTYDYDTVTPGSQPPTAAVLASPSGRILSSLALAFNVYVPVEELQAVLPSEFEAIPAPAPLGPALAGITMYYIFQQQCAQTAGAISAPATGLAMYHFARNTVLSRTESLALAAEMSDASFVACHQAVLGPNGSRVADVETEAKLIRGQLQLKFHVEDEEIGLQTRVWAEGSSTLIARGNHADPTLFASRTLNGGLLANPAHRWSVMSDQLSVTATPTNFRLEIGGRGPVPERQLGLPGGAVSVVAAEPGFRFTRFENYYQPE
jgi:hypothetical protein